ncbi:DUF397 domain-containing protein [Streptomyces sp. NPDC002536]
MRDSKASRGPALAFPAQAWAAFVMDIRAEGAADRAVPRAPTGRPGRAHAAEPHM